MMGAIDLDVTVRFPAAPDDETIGKMARAARAGGVAVVVVSIEGNAAVDAPSLAALTATLARHSDGLLLIPAIKPFQGGGLTELNSLERPGEGTGRPVWRVMKPVDDMLVVRRLGDLARAHDAIVMVPSVDGSLAADGIAIEGGIATRLGLPAVPEAAEAIGIGRIVEMARLTGARFHVAGVFTAAGAARIEAGAADGVAVTGSVCAAHLLIDESALIHLPYDSRLLRSPPLPTASAREALVAAVERGALLVASGHLHVPKRERDLELTRATPGGTALSSTARLLGAVLSSAALRAAYVDGPRRLLGLDDDAMAVGGGVDVDVDVGIDADDLATLVLECRR